MKVVGNRVELDGDDLANAVDAYLAERRIAFVGPRTIRIFDCNGWTLCGEAREESDIVPEPRLGKLATIDTTSPENVQRAALLFAASILLEVAEPKHDLAPNRTWEDAIAALERWATGAIGSQTR